MTHVKCLLFVLINRYKGPSFFVCTRFTTDLNHPDIHITQLLILLDDHFFGQGFSLTIPFINDPLARQISVINNIFSWNHRVDIGKGMFVQAYRDRWAIIMFFAM